MPHQLSWTSLHPVTHPQHQPGCSKENGAWHQGTSQSHDDAGCPTCAISCVKASAWSRAGISPSS